MKPEPYNYDMVILPYEQDLAYKAAHNMAARWKRVEYEELASEATLWLYSHVKEVVNCRNLDITSYNKLIETGLYLKTFANYLNDRNHKKEGQVYIVSSIKRELSSIAASETEHVIGMSLEKNFKYDKNTVRTVLEIIFYKLPDGEYEIKDTKDIYADLTANYNWTEKQIEAIISTIIDIKLAVGKLSQNDLSMLADRYYSKLSTVVMAKARNVSTQAINSKLNRLIKRIQTIISKG
jgi:hypothetical protein